MRADTQPEFVDFHVPFGGKLDPENRWVKLAGPVPWEAVEERYAAALAGTGMGAPPMSGRIALGALIIKERLGVTDEERSFRRSTRTHICSTSSAIGRCSKHRHLTLR